MKLPQPELNHVPKVLTLPDLVTRIYDCAMNPRAWRSVLQGIAQATGAYGAMIFDCAWDGRKERVALRYCSEVYDPALVGWYVDTHNANEVRDQGRFAQLSSKGNEINLIRCDDLYSSREELERQDNQQAMMKFGVYYRAGALLSKDTDAMDRFALQFHKDQGPISEPARQMALGLLPHVAKALSIGRALQACEDQKRALTLTLEAVPFGIGIISAKGHILYGNTEFRALSDRLRLIGPGPTDFRAQNLPLPMQGLLRSAREHGKFGARPLREAAFLAEKGEGTGIFIEISPISSHPELDRFGEGVYLVSLLDNGRAHRIDPDIVRRFFPMTESELLVLQMAIKGHTNSEIADMRGRSLETVNSQMKSLIRKSGTRNRTELVRVAVSLSVTSLIEPKARRAE